MRRQQCSPDVARRASERNSEAHASGKQASQQKSIAAAMASPASKVPKLGDQVVVTGPVLLSYDTFTISVAQVGQLTITTAD